MMQLDNSLLTQVQHHCGRVNGVMHRPAAPGPPVSMRPPEDAGKGGEGSTDLIRLQQERLSSSARPQN